MARTKIIATLGPATADRAIDHRRDIYETFNEHLLSLSPEDEEGEMPPLQG